jgi:hypothetical protein
MNDNIVDSITEFFAIVGVTSLIILFLYIFGWAGPNYYKNKRNSADSINVCAPYQVANYFEDLNHRLVVCRTEKGLIVREIPK